MRGTARLAARWGPLAVWLTVPFLAGPAFADALAIRSRPVQLTGSTILWALWAAGLLLTLVPTTVSLTGVRIVAPAVLVASCWATLSGADSGNAALALIDAWVVLVALTNRWVGHVQVNGSSYGDEERFLLGIAGPLLLGPLEVAWLLLVTGATAGPLLLAAGNWLLGIPAIVVGWPVAYVMTRSMHGLSRRWLVLVPAGLVVHDYSAVTESVLVPRRQLDQVSLGLADTDAVDLTLGALGPGVQIDLVDTLAVSLRPGRRPGRGASAEVVETSSLLVSPVRVLPFLRAVGRRGLPVVAPAAEAAAADSPGDP